MLILGNILVGIMAMLFVATCLFMMLVILIQKPKGGGLSGAFGGAGGSAQAAFGAKTGDLLTTITIACFVLFLGLAIGMKYAIDAEVNPKAPVPVATPVSGPADTSETDAAVEDLIDQANGAGNDLAIPTETDAVTTEETGDTETPQAPVETPAADAQP